MAWQVTSSGNNPILVNTPSDAGAIFNAPASLAGWFLSASFAGAGASLMGSYLPGASNLTGWDFAYQGSGASLPNCSAFAIVNNVNTSVYLQILFNFVASTGIWYHMVITYDGSRTAAGVKFYVNGILQGVQSVALDALSASSANGQFSFAIGDRVQQNDPVTVGGRAAHVALWQRPLTLPEIRRLAFGNAFPDEIGPQLLFYSPLGNFAQTNQAGKFGAIANPVYNTGAIGTTVLDPPMLRARVRDPLNSRFVVRKVTVAASPVVFRKSASSIGTRVGSRQMWAT